MQSYEKLKELREDSNCTQSDIARLLNVSQQYYSLCERGIRKLFTHHFITLAIYYNVSLDYLAGLVDTPRKLY